MRLQFDCVFYYVSDLDRSVRFYRDLLGFQFVARDAVARFRVDGVLFELVPGAVSRPQSGNARIVLQVEDIEEAVRELVENGVPAGPVENKSNGRLAFFLDPDGNELCLWQYLA